MNGCEIRRSLAFPIVMPPTDSPHFDWFHREILPHEGVLRSWLHSRFSNHSDVDDVVQEAYARVLQARERNEAIRSPKAFLFTTARNLALNLARRAKVRGDNLLVDFEATDVLDERAGVAEEVARDQELEIMTKAIQSLPDRCRQIFTLRHVYGLSQKAIAKKLGISPNTVNAQTAIGLNKCADFMERAFAEGWE